MVKRSARILRLKDLHPDPTNPRRHTPRNIGLVVDALHEVGAARSIVIDEQDVVLVGNGTVEAAAEAGITKIHVVEADGDTLIAVRRRGLTPEQKRRLALFDNRTAELAEWDPDVLRALQAQGSDLSNVFTPEELAALLEVEETAAIQALKVDRPSEVVWVLLAIPVEQWPQHQDTIEALQVSAKYCTQVLRQKEADS